MSPFAPYTPTTFTTTANSIGAYYWSAPVHVAPILWTNTRDRDRFHLARARALFADGARTLTVHAELRRVEHVRRAGGGRPGYRRRRVGGAIPSRGGA